MNRRLLVWDIASGLATGAALGAFFGPMFWLWGPVSAACAVVGLLCSWRIWRLESR
jgi:hypothetical protein